MYIYSNIRILEMDWPDLIFDNLIINLQNSRLYREKNNGSKRVCNKFMERMEII